MSILSKRSSSSDVLDTPERSPSNSPSSSFLNEKFKIYDGKQLDLANNELADYVYINKKNKNFKKSKENETSDEADLEMQSYMAGGLKNSHANDEFESSDYFNLSQAASSRSRSLNSTPTSDIWILPGKKDEPDLDNDENKLLNDYQDVDGTSLFKLYAIKKLS
jgi:hypothetical protein